MMLFLLESSHNAERKRSDNDILGTSLLIMLTENVLRTTFSQRPYDIFDICLMLTLKFLVFYK